MNGRSLLFEPTKIVSPVFKRQSGPSDECSVGGIKKVGTTARLLILDRFEKALLIFFSSGLKVVQKTVISCFQFLLQNGFGNYAKAQSTSRYNQVSALHFETIDAVIHALQPRPQIHFHSRKKGGFNERMSWDCWPCEAIPPDEVLFTRAHKPS